MTTQPAELACLRDALARSAADDHPVTLDISKPCPDDVGGAVVVLWQIARQQRDEIARLRAQLAGRM